MLSKEEQRRLITDVIHHAAGNQFSAVEVAYELLLGPHSDARQDLADDDSLGDFVEQCKASIWSLCQFPSYGKEKNEPKS